MAQRKGRMICRMPVLRENNMIKPDHVAVDQRHNVTAACHCQCPRGTKVVLHINDNQRFILHLQSFKARRRIRDYILQN